MSQSPYHVGFTTLSSETSVNALPLRLKVQYMLSASFFLSGWTVLVYMTFPVVRLLTGARTKLRAPKLLPFKAAKEAGPTSST